MDIEYNSSLTESYLYMINVISSNDLYHIKLFFDFNKDLFEFINICFQYGKYPIHYVFMNPYLSNEIIEFFLKNNCKLYCIGFSSSLIEVLFTNTNLSNKKIFQILKFLNSKKFEFKRNDSNINNIYHLVAKSNIFYKYDKINLIYKDKILNFIKKIGCNINSFNINYENPLFTSIKCNNYLYSRYLLSTGYNFSELEINFKDINGDNVLLCLCNFNEKKPDIKLINLLLKKGLYINQVNKKGYSCLHLSSGAITKKTSIKTIIKLLSYGANYNLLDSYNNNFLDYLLKNNSDYALIEKVLSLIKLSDNLKTSLVLNDFKKDKYIKVQKFYFDKTIKCLISRIDIEKGEFFYKCKYNHFFNSEYLIDWFNESGNRSCPLCSNKINLLQCFSLN